jgi:branched-chain amino acid transport system substrate-binding protein
MKLIHAILWIWGLTLGLGLQAQTQNSASKATPGQPLWLGQLASTTHPLTAAMAKDYVAGINLALQRSNAAGGIKGRPLMLATQDDQFDAAQAVSLTERLIAEKDIIAMVGNFGTQPLLKLASEGVLEKHNLASIAPMTGLQSALDKPNVFAVRASYEDEVLAMLQHAARLGRTQLGYLYFEAGVGTHLAKLAPDMAKQAGVQLLGPTGFAVTKNPSEQQTAVRQQLQQWADKRPQAMVLIAVGGVHSEAVKAVREMFGQGMPIYSLGQVSPENLVHDVGRQAAAGVMLTQVMPMPSSQDMPLLREFHKDAARFMPQQALGYMLLEGYTAGRIATELVRRARTPSREGVLQAALNVGELNVSGFRVAYSAAQRKSQHRVELTMVSQNGKLIR